MSRLSYQDLLERVERVVAESQDRTLAHRRTGSSFVLSNGHLGVMPDDFERLTVKAGGAVEIVNSYWQSIHADGEVRRRGVRLTFDDAAAWIERRCPAPNLVAKARTKAIADRLMSLLHGELPAELLVDFEDRVQDLAKDLVDAERGLLKARRAAS